MTRAEDDFRPETLQMRAGAIIDGLKKAFDRGLDPKHVAILHEFSPSEHQDLLLAYLGIKPGAVFLNNVFRIYHPNEEVDYLSSLPGRKETDVEIRYNPTSQSIWNPDQARAILLTQADLSLAAILEGKATNDELNPGMIEFGNFLHNISSARVSQSMRMRILAGILNGYPREAAEFFCQTQTPIIEGVAQIIQEADRLKIPYMFDDDTISVGTIGESEGTRNELLRVAAVIGFDDTHALSLISKIRLAKVPGYRYVTSEGLTIAHEERVSKAYSDSRIEEKLTRLLPEI